MADGDVAQARTKFDKKAYMAEYRRRKATEIAEQRRGYRERTFDRDRASDGARAAKWHKDNPGRHASAMRTAYERKREERISEAAAAKARRKAADPNGERAKAAAYMRSRRQGNLKAIVSYRMANRLWRVLKRKGGKRGAWIAYVDYTVEALIARLAETMPPGWSWEDFMAGRLHIDHIRPIVSFDYCSPEDEAFKACWSLANLQLLPAAENIAKNANMDWPRPLAA